jgi:DNA-binding transcriptional MerR regulator
MPKHYYQIGEVANMLGVRKHTLRYWENEFPKLRPKKNSGGKRSYTLEDIEVLKTIKYLLYDQNFSIEGARKKMNSHNVLPRQEENVIFDHPASELKKKIILKLETIQDFINLSPHAKETVIKKRLIKQKIADIRQLLTNPKTELPEDQ